MIEKINTDCKKTTTTTTLNNNLINLEQTFQDEFTVT